MRDDVINVLHASSMALHAAVRELDRCVEGGHEPPDLCEECAYCECLIAEREVDGVLADRPEGNTMRYMNLKPVPEYVRKKFSAKRLRLRLSIKQVAAIIRRSRSVYYAMMAGGKVCEETMKSIRDWALAPS